MRSSQSISAIICGLDVHKESKYATIIDPDGEIITYRRMPNEEVPEFLSPHRVAKVVMEASTSIASFSRKLGGGTHAVSLGN